MNEELTIPQGWNVKRFEDLLEYIQPTPYIVESTEYSEDYQTPVLTAGKTFILGNTNEEEGIFNSLPVIIFDDFTTANKFVNFSFKVKSSAMKILKPRHESVNIKFVFYYMQTVRITFDTHKRYWISVFSKLPVPSPSPVAQQQIVSKIEELFSEIDKGIEEITTARQQLKVYRQGVLKWGFEGKLTNKDVKEGELLKGWRKEKLGSVSEMCLGKMLDKQKNKGVQMPYLGNINVRWGQFRLDELKLMPFEDDELERFSLKKGDLVICEGGEPGRCAIWKSDSSEMMIQKALHRVRVSNSVDVRYVYHYLSYAAMNGTLTKYFTGTTIKHLTGKELKKIELPMPLLEEQQQIVQEIESRLSVCDKMEETITNSLKQAEALRQSILKKAFEGKLVHSS